MEISSSSSQEMLTESAADSLSEAMEAASISPRARSAASETPAGAPEQGHAYENDMSRRARKGKQVLDAEQAKQAEQADASTRPFVPDPLLALGEEERAMLPRHLNWLLHIAQLDQAAIAMTDPVIIASRNSETIEHALAPFLSLFRGSFPPAQNAIQIDFVMADFLISGIGESAEPGRPLQLVWPLEEMSEDRRSGIVLARLLRQTWLQVLPQATHDYFRMQGVELDVSPRGPDAVTTEAYAMIALALLERIPDPSVAANFWYATQGQVLLQLDQIHAAVGEGRSFYALEADVHARFYIETPSARELRDAYEMAALELTPGAGGDQVSPPNASIAAENDDDEEFERALELSARGAILHRAAGLPALRDVDLAELVRMEYPDVMLDTVAAHAGVDAFDLRNDVEYGLVRDRAWELLEDLDDLEMADRMDDRPTVFALYLNALSPAPVGR